MHKRTCADPESFVRGSGPTLTTFFLLIRGGERIQITLKVGHHDGPPVKQHLNGVFWWANDGPTLNASLVAL